MVAVQPEMPDAVLKTHPECRCGGQLTVERYGDGMSRFAAHSDPLCEQYKNMDPRAFGHWLSTGETVRLVSPPLRGPTRKERRAKASNRKTPRGTGRRRRRK